MQNGPKIMTNTHRPKSARPLDNRSKQWTSNSDRPDFRKSQNAQTSYERYLALAHATTIGVSSSPENSDSRTRTDVTRSKDCR
jgi:hypothetical protein